MLTAGPKGTNDMLPGEAGKWHYLEGLIREICREYGYQEIRTPVFEHTELFLRGVGDTTDVVEKEMYTFIDKGKRNISLRPENTAGVVRAYVEHKMYALPQPVKVFYQGPMFRYANVQAGRFRQFHQFGVEALGSKDPAVDAEVIVMTMDFYRRLGLTNLELHVNSVGCKKCRPKHRQKLQEFLEPVADRLCGLCHSRLERNPMRILDCKEEQCQQLSKDAPTTADVLCEECAAHFETVLRYLQEAGIRYCIDKRLVRGLDYYTNTAFEIMTSDIGAQSSIGGGGRYDGLIEQIGGPPTPGVGFALGLERILAAMERQGLPLPVERRFDVFVAWMGEHAGPAAFGLTCDLRKAGLAAEMDLMGRSLKAQMKFANKLDALFTLILGEEEMEKGTAVVRNMAEGEQKEIPQQSVVNYLVNLTKGKVRE